MRRIGFVETTTIAAFVTDERGRMVAWNPAAEPLLGSRATEVLGSRCFELVAGRDPYGNIYCSPDCGVRRMARRREPVHPFEVLLLRRSGESLRLRCSIIVAPGPRARSRRFVHLLEGADARPQCDAHHPDDHVADNNESPSVEADPPPRVRTRPELLTTRERTVLNLPACGCDTVHAARTMGISLITVPNPVQHILQRLEVHNRLQAIVIARRDHLIQAARKSNSPSHRAGRC
jgi:PAS domain S-box-containing protein